MPETPESYQTILAYLQGTLSREQLARFEKKLQNDADFASLVEDERGNYEAIFEAELYADRLEIEAEMEQLDREERAKKVRKRGTMAILFSGIAFTSLLLGTGIESPDSETKTSETPAVKQLEQEKFVSAQQVENTRHPKKGVKAIHTKEDPVPTFSSGLVEPQVFSTRKDSLVDDLAPAQLEVDSNTSSEEPPLSSPKLISNPCAELQILVKVVTTSSCWDDNTGNIKLETSGGAPPYVFRLDESEDWQKSPQFTTLSPGDYLVQARDQNGCFSILKEAFVEGIYCERAPEAFNANYESWRYPEFDGTRTLQVMSSSGLKVYEMTGEELYWDGNGLDGSPQLMGSYLYLILENGSITDQDHLTLIR